MPFVVSFHRQKESITLVGNQGKFPKQECEEKM